MQLKIIKTEFAICKLESLTEVDLADDIFFVAKTDEEISLVCSVDRVPTNATECDKTWRALKIQGVLDFSLVGILSKISNILAEKNIGIFAVSTYNTDYILTKQENFDKAICALRGKGYSVFE